MPANFFQLNVKNLEDSVIGEKSDQLFTAAMFIIISGNYGN